MIQEVKCIFDGKCGVNALLRVRDYVWASQESGLSIWSIKKHELVKKLKGVSYGALVLVGKNIWCATIDAPNAIHVRPRDVCSHSFFHFTFYISPPFYLTFTNFIYHLFFFS